MRTRAGFTLALAAAVISGFAVFTHSYGGAIITALLQAGVQGTAFPQWPGTALVLAGAAIVGLAAIRKPRTALVEVR
jgi:hypothetical protein